MIDYGITMRRNTDILISTNNNIWIRFQQSDRLLMQPAVAFARDGVVCELIGIGILCAIKLKPGKFTLTSVMLFGQLL